MDDDSDVSDSDYDSDDDDSDDDSKKNEVWEQLKKKYLNVAGTGKAAETSESGVLSNTGDLSSSVTPARNKGTPRKKPKRRLSDS
jgi:hypothetical protein